jgi:POT family proton-dependent oligopeptide transporter
MVTKLAPKHMTGTAMGGWFWSFAMSNYLAAVIAMATGQEGEGGAESALPPAQSLALYTDVYTSMGLITVGVGVLLLILNKPLNRLMHGVV